jgi:hypothetical protein
VPAAAALWAVSVPGIAFFSAWGAVWILALSAVLWAVRVITYVRGRRRDGAIGAAWWFLVAPAGGALVLALIISDAPLRARWALSQHAFEQAVSHVPSSPSRTEWEQLTPDRGRVGWYDVTTIYRVGDAVIFYEQTGDLIDNAGFAYLPSGPFPELSNGSFESPRFVHLSGPWYAWTASW